MPIRRFFIATLPSLLLLSALVGALIAVVFPPAGIDRKAPADPAAHSIGDAIGPAVQTLGERSAEEQSAWAQMAATFDLVRSSQLVLEEAQSLRAIAAALAAKSRGDREPARADEGADELDKARRELTEGQLALADKVLLAAQLHAANAEAALNVAWQNLQRATQDNAWPDSSEPMRAAADRRRYPG